MFSRYRELGFSAIPVYKSAKNPVLNEWSQFCDRLPTQEESELWDKEYDGFNVGIALGSASNLMAVDIDTDDQSILDACPPSPVRKRGVKGETRFFKYNPEIGSSKIGVVDILSNGRQTVMPPSIHPSGVAYIYITADQLGDVDLPEITLEDLSQIRSAQSLESKSFGGRNPELVAMVTAMRARGETEEKTVQEIYEHDRSHNPIRLFTDKSERFNAANETDAFNNARTFVARVTASIARKGIIPAHIELPSQDAPSIIPARLELRKLPELPGKMKEIKEEILHTSVKPNDVYATCAVISLFSVLCSTRYILKNNRPATFCMLLGDTGSGKDSVRSFLSSVLTSDELRRFNLLGIQNYVSAPATVIDLPKQRTRLDLVDEFSSFIRAAANPMTGYKREVMTELTQILTLNDDYYAGIRAVGRQETGACHAPSISLLAMVQPRTFIESANRDMLETGFFSRFMYFYSDEINEMNREALLADNKSYPVTLAAIKELFPKPETIDSLEDVMVGAIKPRLHSMVMSKEVENYYVDALCYFDKKKSSDEIEQILLTRAGQNMNKLAQMFAVACGRTAILKSDIDLAQEMVETLIYNSANLLREATGDSYKAKMHERFIAFMQKKVSVSSKQVIDLFKGNRALRESIMKDCIESGQIVVEQKGKKQTYHFQE